MGGVIAQSFAQHRPEKVTRLVLSDTFGELKTFQEKILGFSQVVGFRIFKILGGKMLAKGMASTYKAPFAHQAQEYFYQTSLNAEFDQLFLAKVTLPSIYALGRLPDERVTILPTPLHRDKRRSARPGPGRSQDLGGSRRESYRYQTR